MIKLLQGDCLEVMNTIPDKSVDLILTDPPYGTTKCKWDTIINLELMWEQLNRIIKKDCAIVLMSNQPYTTKLIYSNIKNFKYNWVWNKKQGGNPLNAKRQPLRITEDIIIFNSKRYYPQMRTGKMRKKGGITKQPQTTNKVNLDYVVKNDQYYPTTIIERSNSNRKYGRFHPTQKPIELMEYLIKTYSKDGELVLDFTMGSGTTGIACKNLNRNFIGIEIDKGYYNIAKMRINDGGKDDKIE
jgi:site-specific DNA-methyltransferase (adenine-specific)